MVLEDIRPAIRNYRRFGFRAVVQMAKEKYDTPIGPVERVADRITRWHCCDPYTLSPTNRYTRSYIKSRFRGEEAVELIKHHTGHHFDGDECVLDIGCGPGRLAGAFARENPQLRYVGIDIDEHLIMALKRRYSNTAFQFHHKDIKNGYYNREGEVPPSKVKFDIPHESVDLIILRSVFTHLKPEAVENYLGQFSELLTDDGVVWATAFLIQFEPDRSDGDRVWGIDHDGYYSVPDSIVEEAIAYDRTAFEALVRLGGLEMTKYIQGHWRYPDRYRHDRERYHQDQILLTPQ